MLFCRLWPCSFPICSSTLPRAPSHGATIHCHKEVPAGPCIESGALPTGPWPLELRSCLLRDGSRQLRYPLDWSPLGLTVLKDFGSLQEKAMAPHSSTLAWRIPWMGEPGRLQSMGSLRVRHDWVTSLSFIGEENGNTLQCSCLENPRDGGAWWVAVYGVTQSQTRLKWFSSSSSSIFWYKFSSILLPALAILYLLVFWDDFPWDYRLWGWGLCWR